MALCILLYSSDRTYSVGEYLIIYTFCYLMYIIPVLFISCIISLFGVSFKKIFFPLATFGIPLLIRKIIAEYKSN